MLSRLAFRNTLKGIKDFSVYFVTLAFGVTAFYAFGSIDSQRAMLELSNRGARSVEQLGTTMDVISVLVALILAFLVVYANSFLIRRRKREFGLYLIMGMPKLQVASVLVLETLQVGLAALATGLIAGVFLSQGLSLLTTKMFEMDMSRFQFVFSPASLVKTVTFFGILFAAVSFLNVLGLSRKTVNSLLNASRTGEPRIRSRFASVTLAFFGALFVASGSALLLKFGLYPSMEYGLIWVEIGLGTLGTFMLFAGGLNLALRVLEANRRVFLRGLNPFVLRQLDAKLTSSYATMATVCIALFFAIVILSSSIALVGALNEGARAPFDASLESYDKATLGSSMETKLEQQGFKFDRYVAASHQFPVYWSALDNSALEDGGRINGLFSDSPLNVVRKSDANELRRMAGLPELRMGSDQFALFGPYGAAESELRKRYPGLTIDFGGKKLTAVPNGFTEIGTEADARSMADVAIVVPDELVEHAQFRKVVTDIIYAEPAEVAEKAFVEITPTRKHPNSAFSVLWTQRQAYADSVGVKATVTFIGLYVGLILLVTSAAILALQQLTEAADNKDRYRSLFRLGASRAEMGRAVVTQVAVYFAIPLAFATIYAVIGGIATLSMISYFGQVDVGPQYAWTALSLALVYGGYFVVTSLTARRMVLER